MTVVELRSGLHRTLEHLSNLAGLGGAPYDDDIMVRLAIQRLWITAGNYVEALRIAAGDAKGGTTVVRAVWIPKRPGAHASEEISDDRVWFEPVEGARRLRAEVIDYP